MLSLDTEAVNLALHELGHSAFQLADEYDSIPGCGRGATPTTPFTGPKSREGPTSPSTPTGPP